MCLQQLEEYEAALESGELGIEQVEDKWNYGWSVQDETSSRRSVTPRACSSPSSAGPAICAGSLVERYGRYVQVV